jgi:hypothetical protein
MSVRKRISRIHQLLDGLYQLEVDQVVAQLLTAPRYQDPKSLARHECRVFSQGGEDGIIAEIFRRIGSANRIFVECAPGDGLECNTLYLLAQGWSGVWVEANPKNLGAIKRAFKKKLSENSLRLQSQHVTAENIEPVLDEASLPADFDLLSVDLDRNDYWVWSKIERYRPRVVLIEYNAIFPPGCGWVVDYDPQAIWDRTSNFGASLTALEQLGVEKGYKLVGCTLAGTNAFFVRDDLAGSHFLDPFTAANHYEPPRYYLTLAKAGHRRSAPFGP